jgi:hypothetical protein
VPELNIPTVEEIDARIIELKSELNVLENLKYVISPRFVDNVEAYKGSSRTGNSKGHSLLYNKINGNISCDCPAAEHGNRCWATKGLWEQRAVNGIQPAVGNSLQFRDEHYNVRTLTRVK